MELTPSELASLRRFDEGEAGWGDENSSQLLDLGLIDFEEDTDNVFFWVTDRGRQILDRNEQSGIDVLFGSVLPDEADALARDPDLRTDWEK